MTLKEFGRKAIEIGCKNRLVNVSAEISRHSNGDMETTYKCYCGADTHKHTQDCPTPEEALSEFERMHSIPQTGVDMAITEESTANAVPFSDRQAFYRKRMD